MPRYATIPSLADLRKRARRKLKPRTGGGLSILGIGGTRPVAGASQQNVVQEIVDWLSTRRVFSDVYEAEGEWYVNASALDVRNYLADILPRLDRKDDARIIVLDWIEECNAHLTAVPDPIQTSTGLRPAVQISLAYLREHFAAGLIDLADGYDVPEAAVLAGEIQAVT